MNNLTRRDFLSNSGSCAAHLALAAAVSPELLRRLWANVPAERIVAAEPFGSLERIADGVWALISTPLNGDRTTISNGGIVAGKDGVLAIEGFNQPEGARWLATQAKTLTGRWPTHVVVTHYHADHANGVAGYSAGDVRSDVRITGVTRDLVLTRNQPSDAARTEAINVATALDGDAPTSIDLGGRSVRVIPRAGHTASDVTLEIEEPSIVFCGDLVWNGMFPNYVDAVPSELARSVAAVRRSRSTTYVPGHGSVANDADFTRYQSMIAEVEAAARQAHASGAPAEVAGAAFKLSPSLGEWVLFNKVFFERAFAAWYRELGAK
jgi:glyoxylase-like metal-dependent hydrolase (beta-lactamase superfamily II)